MKKTLKLSNLKLKNGAITETKKPILKISNSVQKDELLGFKQSVFRRYMDLKNKEAEIKTELEAIKNQFTENKMDGFSTDGRTLKLQIKNTISYEENIIQYLKYKQVEDKCLVVDKKKVEALVKVDILDKDEVKKFEQVKKTTAWTIK